MGTKFTDVEHNKILEMIENKVPKKQIAQSLNRSYDSLDCYLRRNGISYFCDSNKNTKDTDKKKVSMQKNGDMVFEGIIELLYGEPITPDLIMKAHNLDKEKWTVVSFTTNAWQAQAKYGNKTTLWQSKIVVREKKENQITTDIINEFFKNKTNFLSKKELLPFAYNDSNEILEIDYADSHTGLLSWRCETGEDYDLNIAEQRFKECIADTIERCKNRKFKKIIFATLGDILHIDNDKNETTAGTIQQADGRISKIFDRAVNMIMDCLDSLLKLKTPIEYIYVSGNHDRNTGYYLVKTLSMAYRDNKNITFDITQNPRKARLIGKNIIGFCHGDMPVKNLGRWLQQTFRKEYGESLFAEVHCGHLHSESIKEDCGVLVKRLPSICENSYWAHQQGYMPNKGTMCFVWNEETGLRETWYNYI